MDVDFMVQPGHPLAVLGPNGSGKSSILHALSGLLAIRSGQIAVGDRVFDSPADRVFIAPAERKVSLVFQDYRLFDWMSVRANLEFATTKQRGKSQRDDTSVGDLLERFDLGGLSDQRASTLSGGQGQRLAIARALAANPDVLLLDEPFSALDRATGSNVRDVLATVLSDFDGPVVLVTHDWTDALRFCDQAIALDDGVISSFGPVRDVVREVESDGLTGVDRKLLR